MRVILILLKTNIWNEALLLESTRPHRICLPLPHIRQQSGDFFFDDLIALANRAFEAHPFNYGDVATPIPNIAHGLQLSSCFSNAFSSHAEHIRNKLLRNGQLVIG